MGKRQAHDEDDEMEKIAHHLDRQDKTLQEILIVLRGSISLGVEGVVSKLNEMEECQAKMISDIAHLQRWQKMVRENKGKITFSWVEVARTLFSIIGIAGTIVGLFLGIKQLFDNA